MTTQRYIKLRELAKIMRLASQAHPDFLTHSITVEQSDILGWLRFKIEGRKLSEAGYRATNYIDIENGMMSYGETYESE